MATPHTHVVLTEEKIQIESILAGLDEPSSGAVAVFLGRVRDIHEQRAVTSIHYQAYPEMAEPVLQAIASEVAARFPIAGITLVHRFGHLQVGEVSLLIAVASGHRSEAFDACRFALERVKQDVPIWKKEVLADGSEEWVDARTQSKAGVLPG